MKNRNVHTREKKQDSLSDALTDWCTHHGSTFRLVMGTMRYTLAMKAGGVC